MRKNVRYDSHTRIKTFSFDLARVVCIISGVVGIFALASLITALVLNDKSPNYVSSHFSSNLIAYKSNANARDRIDRLQNKYQCCGTDMWIDWTRADLNGTSTETNVTTTTVTTTETTTTSTTTPAVRNIGNVKRDINDISNDQVEQESNKYLRKKRQSTSSYGGIAGLPITFGVVLPQSCCTSEATLTSNSSDACK